MTSRTTDFHCPRCRKYLFSEYTYPMSKAERQKLDEQAATYCPCPPARTLIPVSEVLANSRARAEAAAAIYAAQLDAGIDPA